MEEEVNKFEEGTMTAPELSPMHSYFNSAQHNSWNDAGIELGLDNKMTVENMFFNHLSCLVWPWNDSCKFSYKELYKMELCSN